MQYFSQSLQVLSQLAIVATFTTLQVLLDILLLTWGASEDYEIVVKTLISGYSIWISLFFLFFLEAVIFTTLFRRLTTL